MRPLEAGIVGVLCSVLLIVGTAGCGGVEADRSAVEVEWTLEPDPPRVGTATLTLALADSAGRALTDANVAVEGNMAHAGMRPIFAEATEQDSGRYVAPLEFTMAGDWFLTADVTLPDGEVVTQTIEVRGVRPE